MPTVADELKSLRIERNEPASRLPGWAGPAIAVVVVLVVLGAAWKILAPRIFVPEVETTAVSLVSPAQAQQLLVATGYVVPQRQANISPRIGGRVAKLFIEDGTVVKKGQLIAVLEAADYRAQVLQAKADVAAAQAREKRAESDLFEARLRSREGRPVEGRLDAGGARHGDRAARRRQGAAQRGTVGDGGGRRSRRGRPREPRQLLRPGAVRRPHHAEAHRHRGDRLRRFQRGDGRARRHRLARRFLHLAGRGRRLRKPGSEAGAGNTGRDRPRRFSRPALPGQGGGGAAARGSRQGDRHGEGRLRGRPSRRAPGHGRQGHLPRQGTGCRPGEGGPDFRRAVGCGGRARRKQGRLGGRRAPMGGLVALREGPPAGTKVVRRPNGELRPGMRIKEKQ